MRKKEFYYAMWLIAFLQVFSISSPAQQNILPNIVIILTDDQGVNDVSYYGTKDIHTPNIDALTQTGMRFDNFYANSSVCAPSRASLLSGRYPEMVGVPGVIRGVSENSFGYLIPEVQLLPGLLKQVGYSTALIGKWHLGLESPNLPNEKGFDFFKGFLDGMIQDYWKHTRRGENIMRENDKVINPTGHATDLFTQWAIDYIDQQEKNDNPFFLYLAYNAPHYPIQPPEDWLEKVKTREKNITERRAKLVALIEHMDNGIGKVIDELKRTGQYENTLIIFLSDNGGRLEDAANNGPWRDGKGSVYEGGIRVPAVFNWPKVIQPNSISTEKVLTMDIFPTIAEIIGVTPNQKIDGTSLLEVLKNHNNRIGKFRPLFFIRREGFSEYGGLTIQAVLRGNWKLLQNSPYSPYELYNIYEDPQETRNQIEYQPEVRIKFQKLMMEHIQRGGSVPWQKPIQ